MELNKIGASVLETEYVSYNLRLIRMIPYGKINFIPGQSIALHINRKDMDINNETRYFSVTTPPEAATLLEILIKHNPESVVSNYLFKSIKEGDDLEISGPYGMALLDYNAKKITLIAGGSGIAPFISMIRQIMQNRTNQNIHLIYSVKKSEEFAFKVELDTFALTNSNIRIDYVATKDDKWKGDNKRINFEYLKNKISEMEGLFYICGPAQMIHDVTNYLKELGIKDENIIFEKY